MHDGTYRETIEQRMRAAGKRQVARPNNRLRVMRGPRMLASEC